MLNAGVGLGEPHSDILEGALDFLEEAYMADLERRADAATGLNFKPPVPPDRDWAEPPIPGVPTCSFNVPAFRRMLASHPSAAFKRWVLEGLSEGFDNGSAAAEVRIEHEQHGSAKADEATVLTWLQAEEAKGHVQSFLRPVHAYQRVCPLGLVPKSGGKKRLISDLSFGEDSPNATVDREQYAMKMLRFMDVADLVAGFGPSCRFSLLDIRSAYRQLPLKPAVWHLPVYFAANLYWVDKRVSFGSAASAFLFDSVAAAVHWIIQNELDKVFTPGDAVLVHYLDDFGLFCKDLTTCQEASKIMFRVFAELGIELSNEKEHINVSEAPYLGHWLDAGGQTVSTPAAKKGALIRTLKEVRDAARTNSRVDTGGRKVATQVSKKVVEKLVGQLTWANICLPYHRTWINPLLAFKDGMQRKGVSDRVQSKSFRRAPPASLAVCCDRWIAALETAVPRTLATRPSVLTSRALWCGRESQLVRWVSVVPEATATNASPKPVWKCVNRAEGPVTWDWWGDTYGEQFVVGDASAEIGLGWFNSVRAFHRPWTSLERASHTLGKGATGKVSSTLQELRCLHSAVIAWVESAPQEGAILNYFGDADNVRSLMAKGRSSKTIINDELRRIHQLLEPRSLHARAHWHPRSCWAGVLADLLSRGEMRAFQETSKKFGSHRGPEHPGL